MSLPNRHNPYDFTAFLNWRNSVNYYEDDTFAQQVIRHYAGEDWPEVDREACDIAGKVSYRWRELTEIIATPPNRPYMVHYDGHHNRIDRIVRPQQTEILEQEIFGERLFDQSKSPWVKLVKMFLIYQNGEACVACPMTCTEGLVMLLDRYANTPETLRILQHCREGIDGEIAIGAQGHGVMLIDTTGV